MAQPEHIVINAKGATLNSPAWYHVWPNYQKNLEIKNA
jgi:hypothetical protein